MAAVPPFHPDEGHTVDNQGDGHHHGVMQMGVHPVVQHNTHQAGGDDGHNDLGPQLPGAALLPLVFLGREGV